MRAVVIALALMAAWPQFVVAQTAGGPTGNFFLPMCDAYFSSIYNTNAGMILGYIRGSTDAFAVAGVDGLAYCSPNGVTTDQYTRVVCSFLKDKPNRTNEQMGALTLDALIQAWPCKK